MTSLGKLPRASKGRCNLLIPTCPHVPNELAQLVSIINKCIVIYLKRHERLSSRLVLSLHHFRLHFRWVVAFKCPPNLQIKTQRLNFLVSYREHIRLWIRGFEFEVSSSLGMRVAKNYRLSRNWSM